MEKNDLDKIEAYRVATVKEAEAVYHIVQHTITTVYPRYYPVEVVDFFCKHHSMEAIEEDVRQGNVSVLVVDGAIVGTGCFVDNHITRVYVAPNHQGKGYGTFIMKCIEMEIKSRYEKAILDASLPAAQLYEKLGYKTVKHEKHPVENEAVLAYEVMEKELHFTGTAINYDGKRFVPKMNTENGEVDEQTVFTYHQNGNLLWAEYDGGDIVRGTLIGTVSKDGSLDFTYQHMNTQMQIRIGQCKSTPKRLDNGKVELTEVWQWLNGDCSEGTSVLQEI